MHLKFNEKINVNMPQEQNMFQHHKTHCCIMKLDIINVLQQYCVYSDDLLGVVPDSAIVFAHYVYFLMRNVMRVFVF